VFGVNEALWQVEWVSSVGLTIHIVRFVPRGRSLRCLGFGEDSTRKLVSAIARLRR
jgi:ABC-type enterobactin transport system permease subunit